MPTRGFHGKARNRRDGTRVPPGQHATTDFPVLTAGVTPSVAPERWTLELEDAAGNVFHRYSWKELRALPATRLTADIHCVTKWSKLDTRWAGVSFDTLLEGASPPGTHVMALSTGGYTTNLAVADLVGEQALLAYEFDGRPLPAQHGGPVRLLVPHLYFWKSAKWLRGLRFLPADEPGFWEGNGYHMRGDPWKEERYAGD